MYFNVIASGSKGNATLVITSKAVILIDLGICLKRLNEGLKEENLSINDIDIALFTHNHADHIAGLKYLSPKKLYALEGTLPSESNVLKEKEIFNYKGIEIIPFKVSHDAINPCGYVIIDGDEKLVYMTDTGIFIEDDLDLLKDPTYLIIESNHDISMLLKTDRTMELKQRILSEHGHLCNEDSAFAALEIIGPHTKEIVLAHLSLEANDPDTVLKAYTNIFKYAHVDISKFKIRCANQYESLRGGDI